MKLLIVAVGQRVPDWAQTAYDDYAKRFPPELKIELKAVKTLVVKPAGAKKPAAKKSPAAKSPARAAAKPASASGSKPAAKKAPARSKG